MQGESRLKAYLERVEQRLDELLPGAEEPPARLHQAMRYSALAPGKRIRPLLCLAACEACGGSVTRSIDAACAIEFVHAFSLIHDDLPAIDNDDLRRGRPTLHKAHGEAMAILAGDALFALAFQAIGSAEVPAATRGSLSRVLAEAAGSKGLVGGEVLDILAEGGEPDPAMLSLIHERKTGALIACACEMGATAAGARMHLALALRRFGQAVGLAFQVADDVLNETSTAEQLGKAVGSDRRKKKLTFPAVFGLERSREIAHEALDEALRHLAKVGGDTDLLEQLARFAVDRVK